MADARAFGTPEEAGAALEGFKDAQWSAQVETMNRVRASSAAVLAPHARAAVFAAAAAARNLRSAVAGAGVACMGSLVQALGSRLDADAGVIFAVVLQRSVDDKEFIRSRAGPALEAAAAHLGARKAAAALLDAAQGKERNAAMMAGVARALHLMLSDEGSAAAVAKSDALVRRLVERLSSLQSAKTSEARAAAARAIASLRRSAGDARFERAVHDTLRDGRAAAAVLAVPKGEGAPAAERRPASAPPVTGLPPRRAPSAAAPAASSVRRATPRRMRRTRSEMVPAATAVRAGTEPVPVSALRRGRSTPGRARRAASAHLGDAAVAAVHAEPQRVAPRFGGAAPKREPPVAHRRNGSDPQQRSVFSSLRSGARRVLRPTRSAASSPVEQDAPAPVPVTAAPPTAAAVPVAVPAPKAGDEAGRLMLLFGSATGFALLEWRGDAGAPALAVRAATAGADELTAAVVLVARVPFSSTAEALDSVNKVMAGTVTPVLASFLDSALPPVRDGVVLGVLDPRLGRSLEASHRVACRSDVTVLQLLRAVRRHFDALAGAVVPEEPATEEDEDEEEEKRVEARTPDEDAAPEPTAPATPPAAATALSKFVAAAGADESDEENGGWGNTVLPATPSAVSFEAFDCSSRRGEAAGRRLAMPPTPPPAAALAAGQPPPPPPAN